MDTGDPVRSYDTLEAALEAADSAKDGDYSDGEYCATVQDEDGDTVHTCEWRVDANQDDLDAATWLAQEEGEYDTKKWGISGDGNPVSTIQNGGSSGAYSAQEGDGRWSEMAAPVEEIGWGDLVSAIIAATGDSAEDVLRSIADAHPDHDVADVFRLATEDGWTPDRDDLTVEVDTDDHDWDEDSDGDPICRVRATVNLYLGNTLVIEDGIARGYFSRCCRCGERFSAWQDSEGWERDSDWEAIAKIVTGDEDGLDDEIDVPSEPAEPKESDDGGYVVLYHGWEQDWQVKGRYASEEDAQRAMREAARSTREANGPGAYGWDYAVAAVDPEGDLEVDGLRLTLEDQDNA